MRKIIVFIIVIIGCCIKTNADDKIVVKAIFKEGSVLIRWAPTSYELWNLANKFGYKIERIIISKDANILLGNNIQLLNDKVIKPLNEGEWQEIIKKDSIYAPIALQALWGESFELSSTFKSNVTELYSKVKENESRYGFAMYCADRSLIVAKSLGLYWLDRRVARNEKYIYRIYINTPISQMSDTGYVVVDPLHDAILYKPNKPIISRMGNRIFLAWDANSIDYVGYEVESSKDGRLYKNISKDLIIPFQNKDKMTAFYTDSLVEGQSHYYYRIKGITPFETSGPYSDTTCLYASKQLPTPSHVAGHLIKDSLVIVEWEYPSNVVDLKSFEVLRSEDPTGDYKSVVTIDASKREWVDSNPMHNGYYKIVAISKGGEKFSSEETFMSLPDNLPPAVPSGLKSKVDSSGVIIIRWNENLEKDLLGYKVFRSNSKEGVFSEITQSVISKPYFKDTVVLKTLTKSVFYRIVSVDKRYNTSLFSSILEQKRPDIIPPVSPVLKNVIKLGGGYLLKWERSPSEDMLNVFIYRQISDSGIFKLIKKVDAQLKEYTDIIGVDNNLSCTYKICAADSAGNISAYSNEFKVSNREQVNSKFNKIILFGKLEQHKEHSFIRLSWSNNNKEVLRIYRKVNNEAFMLYKVIKDQDYFNDINIQEGNMYDYFITYGRTMSNIFNISLL